jgi:hypothetical protein
LLSGFSTLHTFKVSETLWSVTVANIGSARVRGRNLPQMRLQAMCG